MLAANSSIRERATTYTALWLEIGLPCCVCLPRVYQIPHYQNHEYSNFKQILFHLMSFTAN